ncbi:uncharacterized protein LOC121387065 [Gigantopelta aegis]|uniref:uncharacterized protein LOC121387065 n=1 Tax=Gigantopelta aegis TaxID=1735272 RepID=UPI001B88A5F8|nr:uncharacterized protein LOC121387065 [Gigantopelta aegis]
MAKVYYVFELVGRDAYLIPGVLIVCVSVIVNLATIILTLLSPRLRKTPKHLIIINISVVALLHAAFPEALLIELYARYQWIHGCDVFFALEVVAYVLGAIYVLLMASLCVEWIISVAGITCSPSVKYIITAVMVGCCWVVNCVVLIPVATEGRLLEYCAFILDEDSQIAMNVMSYFPQAFSTGMLVVALVVISCLKRRYRRSDHCNTVRSFPVDVVIASFITVVLKFPLIAHLLVKCQDDCNRDAYYRAHAATLALNLVPHALVPFIWLLCRETREAILAIFRKSHDTYAPEENQYPMDGMQKK